MGRAARASLKGTIVSRIEVFADVVCPFTHVGLRRLSEARRARDMSPPMRVRAWPLEWVNGAPLDTDLAAMEIAAFREQVAPELFAGFDPATFPRVLRFRRSDSWPRRTRWTT